jgi:phosphoribosyl 1,2-cyclic phosphate phosphodiesterase
MSDRVIIEILGSGGAHTIPRPLCECKICSEARIKGGRYERTGPSVFIHGADILFDTPEEIKYQLNRSMIKNINACFYSHWHPDHTMGCRVWEYNRDPRMPRDQRGKVDIYLPERVNEDLITRGLIGGFNWMEKCQVIQRHIVRDNDSVTLGDAVVTPFRLAEEIAYGFDIRMQGKRILLLIDEVLNWVPDEHFQNADLVILQTGIMAMNPLTGERVIPADRSILQTEPSWQDTLVMAQRLKAKQTVFCHISEFYSLSYDDFCTLEKQLQLEERNIQFAYDGMKITL